MNYSIILTIAGKAKIAQAIANNTTIKLTQIAFGDGNGEEITPDQNQTSLIKEVYRANILSLTKHPSDNSVIVAECIIPVTAGDFYIHEIGIYDETNTLIAIGNYPSFYKEDENSGAASELKVSVMLKINGANAELTINSSLIFATKKYADDIKTNLETQITQVQTSIQNSIQTSLEQISITVAEKQDEIPVFFAEGEFLTAEPDLGSDTILLKLY
ncbi:MAG: phage tail protein [Campylobacteraceae bacterium]|jgi:phage-related tail fiber protein|nr:phage tail protein [Campylobacteraceae bacterium]